MSTRACYRFVDQNGYEATVYIHQDGYPSYAWNYFSRTLRSGLTWPLPRYDAHEFAAAFVSTNKVKPGGVYLTNKWNDHGDLEYLYKLTINHSVLILKVERVSAPESGPLKPSRWKRNMVYHFPLHRLVFPKGQPMLWQGSTEMKIEEINRILQAPEETDSVIEDLIEEIDRLGLANMPGDTFSNLSNLVERLRS